jgi:hypothetical protein
VLTIGGTQVRVAGDETAGTPFAAWCGHMRSIALVALLAVSTGGCYLGRTRSAKTSAYVINGMAALVGGAVVMSASNGGSQQHDDVSGGVGAGLASGAQVTVGGLVVIGALIATVITVAVPTEAEPVPDPEPRTVATGTVTAPGLTPAIVHLR